jgi:hypothetical protein
MFSADLFESYRDKNSLFGAVNQVYRWTKKKVFGYRAREWLVEKDF